MSSRRGFALITTLWLVVALASAGAVGLVIAREGVTASQNRLVLRRAAWAREACVAILLGRYRASEPLRGVDSTDLGRRTWCRASPYDPSSRLNLNLATEEQLRRLFGEDSLASALLDWRDPDDVPRTHGAERLQYAALRRPPPRNGPLADVAELALVLGFEDVSADWAREHVTVRGRGIVNLMRAAPAVIGALGWFEPADVEAIVAMRQRQMMPGSVDALLEMLPSARRDSVRMRSRELMAALTVHSSELVAEVEGGVGESQLRAHATLTVIALPERLAMVRRELR